MALILMLLKGWRITSKSLKDSEEALILKVVGMESSLPVCNGGCISPQDAKIL